MTPTTHTTTSCHVFSMGSVRKTKKNCQFKARQHSNQTLWPQIHAHVLFPAFLSLPVLTNLKSYDSRRQTCVIPPQLTLPISTVINSHFWKSEIW